MKQFIKKTIVLIGLLPFVDWAVQTFSKHNIIDFGISIKYYLFNHWITYFPNYKFRLFYLRNIIGVTIGKECFIHMGCFLDGNNLSIGNNCVIGRYCYLGASGGNLIIKNNISITAQTYIFCATHDKDNKEFKAIYKDVIIDDYAWIGARATILPGVHIGKGAILGAASTATKNIPAFKVYAGSPAKEVGTRNNNLTYKLRYFPNLQ